MSKKLFLMFAAILMVFAFASSNAVAGEATTVYLELTKQTTAPYDPSPIRGRVSLIDAAGTLATTFNGQSIADATLVISSLTFGNDVGVSIDSYTTPVSALTFAAAPLTIDLDSAWHEFALSYNDIAEVGNDVLRATLKSGTTTISADMAITVKGPMANCYVVRSGGIAASALPAVLDPIPNPQNDKGLSRRAGDFVPIDVFAAYGADTDGDGDVDEFIFTDQLPAGAENVSISGGASASVVLVAGHVATTIQVTSLGLASTLASNNTMALQLAAAQNVLDNGKTITWTASSSIVGEIGTKCGDVNTDEQVDLCGQNTFGNIANLTLDAGVSATFSSDTSLFFPDLIQTVNLVGLPITSVANTGATEGFLASGSVSPLDAIYYLPDWTTKQSTFKVNGDGSGDVVYGALIGFDAYKNPAPFVEGGTATFTLLTTAGAPAITAISPWATGSGSTLIAAASSFFVPFQATVNVTGLYVDPTSSPVAASVISTINSAAKGVTFAIAQNVTAMPTTPPFPVVAAQAGGKGIVVGVTGTSQENSFELRVIKQTGSVVKVNKEGEATGATSVAIPLKKAADNTAEQKVAFYTTVADLNLHYIFTGDSTKTIFAFKDPVTARVEPADPGDFPPSAVSAGVTKAGAIIDNDIEEVSTCTFGVSDAFGNSYKFAPGGTTVTTIEDSDATATVFLEDGTTPFPGAKASIDNNDVSVQFSFDEVPAGATTAILKVTAGSASAQTIINVRSLQQTVLANPFIAINGINDTPVVLNFGDQNGALIAPVIGKSPGCLDPGYDVDIETVDGSLTGIGETKTLTTAAPKATFTAKPNTGKTIMTIAADGGDAKATNTTLTLDFNADFEPPVIGAVTAGSCSINIACTDNKALNLTGSVVTVKKSSGEDITATLERTDTGNGTPTGSIQFTKLPGVDTYILDIVLKDKANNTTTGQRSATVTTCEQPACAGVNPTFGRIGNTLDVVITGTNTNFGATSVVTFSSADVTVNSQNATSATSITANITIAASATNATKCDVTVTSGSEVVTCAQAFELTTITDITCASVEPASVTAGETKDVVITLTNVDLTGLTGTVAFGCTGVTVNSSTVTSATTITANITVAKTAQTCTGDVTITGVSDVGVVCKNAFSVEALPACTITVDPSTVVTGFFLPRTYTITVTAGDSCVFDDTTTVTFTGNVTIVGTPVISGNTATVKIRTRPVILGGKGANTLTVTTGAQTATATLTVKGLFF
jgi:hypothetical protein